MNNKSEEHRAADSRTPPSVPAAARSGRFFRLAFVAAVGLAILILCLPWIVAATPLRDALIRAALANPHLSASTRSASLGWFSSVRISELRIARDDGQFQLDIQRVETEKPWLKIWWELPAIGQITVDRPTVAVVASSIPREAESQPAGGSHRRERPHLSVVVNDANLSVVVPPQEQPVVKLDGLNFSVRIEPQGDGRRLIIDPATVFNHRQLTEEMCDRGLQLFAPVLADAARVEGEVSLQIDSFEMPLDQPSGTPLVEQVEFTGQLRLHQVTTGVKNPLINNIAKFVAGLLRVEMPRHIRIADEATVRFELRDGRVFHEGLAFGLPEVSPDLVIRTSGTVGLDETVDLLVEIPLPLNLLTDGPIARRLSERPLTLRVSGTLADPKVRLPDGEGVLKELASRLLNDPGAVQQEGDLAGSILKLMGEIVDERRNENGELETPLLDRLRQRRLERPEEPTSNSETSPEATPRRPGLLRRRGREP